MEEVTFDLQTITPLFLTGVNQETAELRAPSFRGAMRYWLRALVGGIYGTDDEGLKKVREAEAAVFGATDSGSSVRVKVSNASQEARPFTEKISIRVGGEWQATGKGYLLWSMAQSGKADKGNFKAARWFFPSGTQLSVSLFARENNQYFQEAISAFWLLTQLGGMGSRSRRCGGSLAVQFAKGNTPELSFTPSTTTQALKSNLEQGISAARTMYHVAPRHVNEPQFDILSRGNCRIWLLQNGNQPWRSAEEAMKTIGEELQGYRSTIPIQQRKVFGLPLKNFSGRRSSPLLLRVTKLQNAQYVGIAVLFKTKAAGIPMSDYAIIEDWIAKDFPNALEVQL